MGHTDRILDDIRSEIAPSDETLDAARSRREEVLAAASGFDGALRTYASGSIAHRTANDDTDADCGIVLDRRSYQELGPDGGGEGPEGVMEGVRDLVRDKLKDAHPKLKTRLTKRAIEVKFHEPIGSGDDATDPSVDLIVALTRKENEGLWIPNRNSGGWDASHPECHTKLLTDPPQDVRRVRARAIRLVKAWNKQFSSPDPPENRWVFEDGLLALLGLIRLHLLREAWWRETKDWAGPEAPHGNARAKEKAAA